MSRLPATFVPDYELPCPDCGYDLRGHADQAPCPECGLVVSAAALAQAENRWADRRLLDLWSVGLFLILGLLSSGVSFIAFRRGEQVAVVTGMMAGLYLVAALGWFAVVVAAAAHHRSRPLYRTITPSRRGRLRNWFLFDAALVALVVLFFAAFARP